MNFSDFEAQIQQALNQLNSFKQSQSQSPTQARETEITAALSTSIEELHVAAEELQTQNSQLIATRAELEKERQQYQNLFDSAPDGYIITDRLGKIKNANRAAEKLLGVRRDRLVDKPLTVFVADSFHRVFRTRLNSLTAEEINNWEIQLKPRQQEPFCASISLAVECDSGGDIEQLLWSIRDISDRVAYEQKIRQQAQLLEVTTDAVIVIDIEDRVTYCNSSAKKLYGWNEAKVLNTDLKKLWETDLPQLMAAKNSTLERGEWRGELTKFTATGSKLLLESRWSLVRDCLGSRPRIMMVETDITEKNRLELQLYHAQRLESLGTLASGIAHDLNNILNPILGSAQLLPRTLVAPKEISLKLIKTIERSAKRGAAIVTQILAFSRAKEHKLNPLQISEVLREIVQMIEEVFPRAIAIATNISNDLGLVNADATQIHQAVLNLCINARDAMPDGGRLTLSATNSFVDENHARQHLNAHVRDYVVITVADTGEGIAPQILERIFEPFFTTREIGQGTGLGLFTLIEIVKSHAGFVDVKSEVGRGTQFQIFLPAIDRVRMPSADKTPTTMSQGDGELILVVDDEEDNLLMTETMLDMAGYRVITARGGDEAIAVFERHHTEIKLVLMDMMMPQMDGETAIERLAATDSQLKVIGLSGLVCQNSLADNPHVRDFIAKPVIIKDLLAAIERVLQARSST